ncbi:LppA family lipoprotein [Mycolicibacterium sp. HK-90]|uniref:LppA family lipoprotein n=1 Tax=Mycolicibacterium sp. HK-90 TaxID=3056937 RepID=UPI00265A84C1|nr:LppA family lipoprotein [Mycolicibacterium sp. HK-90]WKG02330.1 LppA family lipoprotein [Mycolicibacterium sp. HK-90]
MGRIIIAVTLTIVLAGCGHIFDTMPPVKGEGDYGYGVPEELEPLLARRDAEEVLADRDRMTTEVTTELSRIVPGGNWLRDSEGTRTPCGEFGSTDGKIDFGPHYFSQIPVPASLWPSASQAVVDIAAKYGYTDVTSRTENATDEVHKNLTIRDADGGRLAFGSLEASTLQVTTGCYLTAEEKRQAREAAPK